MHSDCLLNKITRSAQNHSIRLRIVFMQTICGCLIPTTKTTHENRSMITFPIAIFTYCSRRANFFFFFFLFRETPPKTATFKMRNEPNDAECQLKGIRNIYIQILHHQPCIKDVEILNFKNITNIANWMHMTNIYVKLKLTVKIVSISPLILYSWHTCK